MSSSVTEVVKVRYADDVCQECGAFLEPGMYPFCKGNPANHGQRRYYEIAPYEIEVNGQKVVIDSLQKAMKVEREAEARGEKLGLRMWHQDPSNMDKNCFASLDPRVPHSDRDRRGNPYVTKAQRDGIEQDAARIVKQLMGGWD